MSLAETKYVVFPEGTLTNEATENWPELVRRWLVQCPNCSEVRLVVGAQENEPYVCKDCGHSFTINLSRCK
jgi:transposase-like protein